MSLDGLLLAEADLVLRARNYSGEGNWIDESPNAFEAVPIGTPQWDGRRVTMVGGRDGFTIPHSTVLNYAGELTIVALAKVEFGPADADETGIQVVCKGVLTGTEINLPDVGYQVYARAVSNSREWRAVVTDGTNRRRTEHPWGVFPEATAFRNGLVLARDNSPAAVTLYRDGAVPTSGGIGTPPTGSLANTEDLRIGHPFFDSGGAGTTATIHLWGLALFGRVLNTSEMIQATTELAAGEVFDPESQYGTPVAIRTLAYEGQDGGNFADLADEALMTNLSMDLQDPNDNAGDMWNPQELQMELRALDDVWEGPATAADELLVPQGLGFSGVVGIRRTGQGTGDVKSIMSVIFNDTDMTWRFGLNSDHQPTFRVWQNDQLDDQEVVLAETLPLEEKAALAFSVDRIGNTIKVFWLNRGLIEQAPFALTGNIGLTVNVTTLQIGGGTIETPTSFFVGDFFGAVVCRQALEEEQLRQIAAWIDPEILDDNIQVSASLRDSSWRVGAPRT